MRWSARVGSNSLASLDSVLTMPASIVDQSIGTFDNFMPLALDLCRKRT